MTIARKPKGRIIIDLDGPEGNAYVLLGYAQQWAKQLGYSKKEVNAILDDMTSADYPHLVGTFDKHFGAVCVLQTEQEELLPSASLTKKRK